MLPSSSCIETRSSWNGSRGGSVDSNSVGTVGHSVPSIAQIGGRVTITTVRIPSKAAIAQA